MGFIRNLPTTLVDAFRATLEEVTAAALLVHVVDVSAQTAGEQTSHVMKVLAEIGAESTPQVLVFNKSDRLNEADRAQDLPTLTHRMLSDTGRQNAGQAVLISARNGEGLPALLKLIDENLVEDPVIRQRFRLPLGEGLALHLLHDRAAIISKRYEDDYCEVIADVPQSLKNRLAQFSLNETVTD